MVVVCDGMGAPCAPPQQRAERKRAVQSRSRSDSQPNPDITEA
jgi:hypothetical protein